MGETREIPTIDATAIPPEIRSPQLFIDAFDDLVIGASFVIHNDHDPRPLIELFETRRTGEFAWEYLMHGPRNWRIKITRCAGARPSAPEESPAGPLGQSCCGR